MADGTDNIQDYRKNQLELERAREADQERRQFMAEIEDLHEKGKSFGHPSTIKYAVLFLLAIVIDVVGFFDLTGFGWIVGKLITVPSFLLSWGICVATNTKNKEAHTYVANLEKKLLQFGATSRFLVKQTAKLLGKNPWIFVLVGEGIDEILPPIISLLWLSTFWVAVAYYTEWRTYKHAEEAAENLLEFKRQ